jgi:hypothetical protein
VAALNVVDGDYWLQTRSDRAVGEKLLLRSDARQSSVH